MSGFIVVIIFLWLFYFLLCKAIWITIMYEMCYINKLALPNIFMETDTFFRILWWKESSNEKHLFEIEICLYCHSNHAHFLIFCNLI